MKAEPGREEEETVFLSEVGRVFTTTQDMETLLKKILELAASHLGVKRGTIHIYREETDDILIDVAYGYSSAEVARGRYKPGEGITGKVISSGLPIVVPSVDDDPRFLNKTRARACGEGSGIAFICVPVRIGDAAIGAVSVDIPGRDQGGFETELNMLTIVSIMIAHAVNARREMRRREEVLREENMKLKARLGIDRGARRIIGSSGVISDLYEKILLAAPTTTTVLITGESGTGKELIADEIHYNSPRREGPFIKVNITALPETLVESELFGHEKGAFTGALARKMGRFELASGGTIFLDEIGDLRPDLQVKLLRVLQQRCIERIGGSSPLPIDVRIIAATHRNLEEMMRSGGFREDLYYRLNVFPLVAPPLRERKSDIMLLADHFLEKYSSQYGRAVNRISSEAIDMLAAYHWPGNVRELENCIERAVVLSTGDVVRSYHLPPTLQMAHGENGAPGTLKEMTEQFQREIIIDRLKMHYGNITAAAGSLGTTKRILTCRVESLGIDYKKYR
jgi:Nif-specific regulatory protein